MYNPILDVPPFEWGGAKLRTDFKQGLKFFRIAENKKFDEQEKAWLYIRCFFQMTPKLDGVFDFIEYYITRGKKGGGESKKIFDFDIDSGKIYAAFMQAYKIDLKKEKMHWWDFLELFQNLPEGTVLSRVMEIRGKKKQKGDSKEYWAEISRMKRLVALEPEEMDLFGAW